MLLWPLCISSKLVQKLPKVEELKRHLTSQQMFFTKAKSQSGAAVKVSFIVAEEIKSAQPFTEGEFQKSCMMKVCDVMCPDKKQVFANVSLSFVRWPQIAKHS